MNKFYIWSNEHKAWWRWGGQGYTKAKRDAGKFSAFEAANICCNANQFQHDDCAPDESMVPVDFPVFEH